LTKHGFKERTRRTILKRHGQARTGYGHIEDRRVSTDPRKTLTMRLLEDKFDLPMEQILMEGDLKEVGDRLGIHISTVSKWRLRLGLRDGC
jgi:hypothetical protein